MVREQDRIGVVKGGLDTPTAAIRSCSTDPASACNTCFLAWGSGIRGEKSIGDIESTRDVKSWHHGLECGQSAVRRFMLSLHEQTKKRSKLKVKSSEGDTYYDHEAGHTKWHMKKARSEGEWGAVYERTRRIASKVSCLMSSSPVDSACEQALHQGIGAGRGDQLGW
jgi:hypothetical protein